MHGLDLAEPDGVNAPVRLYASRGHAAVLFDLCLYIEVATGAASMRLV